MGDTPPDEETAGPVADPFERHVAFIERCDARRATTLADRITLEPLRPLDIGIESMLDLDGLEALATWHGLFQPPRDKRPGELNPDVEAQLKECMPQFHLRNIGRYERFCDPDGDMELSHDRVPYGLHADEQYEVSIGPYEPIALLEEMNLDVVRNYQRRMRWLIHETAWSRHFSQELRESIRGPLWRYDPDDEAP